MSATQTNGHKTNGHSAKTEKWIKIFTVMGMDAKEMKPRIEQRTEKAEYKLKDLEFKTFGSAKKFVVMELTAAIKHLSKMRHDIWAMKRPSSKPHAEKKAA
jgi:hypothetical protein